MPHNLDEIFIHQIMSVRHFTDDNLGNVFLYYHKLLPELSANLERIRWDFQ